MSDKFAISLGSSPARVVMAEEMADFFFARYSFDDFGLFLDAPNPVITFQLIGATTLVDLGDHASEPEGRYAFGDISVMVLDDRGASMGSYSLWDARAEADAASRMWTVTAETQLPPHVEAARLWDRWRSSPPTEKGEWEAIPVGLREGWVEVSALRHSEPAADILSVDGGDDIVLEGRHICDVASFFCAVGEAFRGPGGDFGSDYTSLGEYLQEHVGERRVRLHWKDISVAQGSLAGIVETNDGMMSQFDKIVKILSRGNVDVLPM